MISLIMHSKEVMRKYYMQENFIQCSQNYVEPQWNHDLCEQTLSP
jgi:hypothetical protein